MNQQAPKEANIRREFVAPAPVGAHDDARSLSQFREGDDALRVWCRGRGQTDKCGRLVENPQCTVFGRVAAIQLIVNRELGLNVCENPWQGSFIVDALTDLVEDAVYKESEAISEHGAVLGAMDTVYQREIQEESMYFEQKKHDGSLPVIRMNTYLPKDHGGVITTSIELTRSTEEVKTQRIGNVRVHQEARNALSWGEDDSTSPEALKVFQVTAWARRSLFEGLMEAEKYHSLGQISHALYEGVSEEYVRFTKYTGAATALLNHNLRVVRRHRRCWSA